MATLESIIDRAISVANSKGLSASKRVTVVIENQNSEVMLIVSHDEPASVEAPLNIVWVNGNPSSPDYKVARKRASRVATSPFTHSWNTISSINDLTSQWWDTPEPTDQDHNLHKDNIDNPHRTTAEQTGAVPVTGGTMQGALHLRVPVSPDDYATTEAVPRSWVVAYVESVRALAANVKQAQASILAQITNIRNRVVALENKFLQTKAYRFTQADPASTWTITHNLNNQFVVVSIFDVNGDIMMAPTRIIDNNNIVITFSSPESGKATVQLVTP